MQHSTIRMNNAHVALWNTVAKNHVPTEPMAADDVRNITLTSFVFQAGRAGS